MKSSLKIFLALCLMLLAYGQGHAQSTVYLVSTNDQTAETMTIYVNGGADGEIEMTSPFHKAKCMGYLKFYKKMIRKCTFNEQGQTVLSYDVVFGSGKRIHQELSLNLKEGETYYVKVWGNKWSMKEITSKEYEKLTKDSSSFHICPDWSSSSK